MNIAEAYDPATRWGRAFGWRPEPGQPNPYTISGYHRGQDIRKLNAAGTASIVTDVVSLSAGRVSHLYTSKSTGREIVVDTGRTRGRYEIHCHNAYFPGLGVQVSPGSTLSENATASQQPGTAWSGPHDHFVISDYPDAAHNDRPVYDPREFITAALATTAGDNSRPFTPATPAKEKTMYLKPTEGTDMVRKGNTYADDGPAGSFRGLTNLESVFLDAEVAAGRAAVHAISGADMELMFALRGAAEQPEVTALKFQGGAKTLSGLGAPTGRIKLPGAPGFRGDWHYPPVSNR